jgi:hypothetical protein
VELRKINVLKLGGVSAEMCGVSVEYRRIFAELLEFRRSFGDVV